MTNEAPGAISTLYLSIRLLNTVYTCTLIHLLPLADLSEQRYAIFNEIIVLLVIYFLITRDAPWLLEIEDDTAH